MTHKFRAWDKKEKRFLEDHQIFISGYGLKRGNHGDHMSMEKQDSVVIMQSTGIKDKNGVEIFEGDVLDFDEREWGGMFDPEIVTMDKIIGDWGLCGSYHDVSDWRQVIGNVWENEEYREGE